MSDTVMHNIKNIYPSLTSQQQIKNTNTQTIYQHKYNTNTRGTQAFLDRSRSFSNHLSFQYLKNAKIEVCTFEIDSFKTSKESPQKKKSHRLQPAITTTITRKL